MMCDVRNIVDRAIERVLVGFRRFSETAQLPNKLQRRRSDFVIRRGRTEVVKCFDGSAHEESLTADYADENGFSRVHFDCWRISRARFASARCSHAMS